MGFGMADLGGHFWRQSIGSSRLFIVRLLGAAIGLLLGGDGCGHGLFWWWRGADDGLRRWLGGVGLHLLGWWINGGVSESEPSSPPLVIFLSRSFGSSGCHQFTLE